MSPRGPSISTGPRRPERKRYGETLAVNTSENPLLSGWTRFVASESNAKSDGVGNAAEPLKESDDCAKNPPFACCPPLLMFARIVWFKLRSRMKRSEKPLVSPETKLLAAETNATYWPLKLIALCRLL